LRTFDILEDFFTEIEHCEWFEVWVCNEEATTGRKLR